MTIKKIIFAAMLIILSLPAGMMAQKVAFISSDAIRKHFLENKQAEQRIQSMVEEWKRELDAMQQEIESLEFEIQKNRLVWSDAERVMKEKELEQKKQNRLQYAKTKFEAGGEYDETVKIIMRPVEEKIYAAVQEVAAEQGFDMVWDQSKQPMPYVNFKYDLTVKVLRKLGVDVDKLEQDLKKKIENDPRNKKKKSYKPRRRSRSSKSREIERDPVENSQPAEGSEEVEEQEENPKEPGEEGKLPEMPTGPNRK